MIWVRRAALFVLAAWPAWVVSVPPLQDLPNHLATAYIQLHPDQYPDLVSNGFLKTNSALFAFLHVAAQVVSLRTAAKLFVTLVALVGAYGYSEAARTLGKNEESASYVLWPLVHNWFVAMGMLDYALGVPLALLGLVALERRRPLIAAFLALAVWYTHAFAVVMLAALVGVDIVARGWRERWRVAAPILPAVLLTGWSALAQLGSEAHVQRAENVYQGVLALLYGAWAECLWSLTKWTLVSLVCVAVLAWYGVRRFRERPAFFSPLAMGVLLAAYLVLPYHAHLWFYVPARILPFVWVGCALRVPTELPLWMKRGLVASAVCFSAGLGIEYVRVAHDWDEVARGEVAVPERSRLLPMVFDRKGPDGDNTWPMLHVWGLYVIDRGTSAPLVFAHSRSFPVSYAEEPPERFHGIYLEQLPQTLATSGKLCNHLKEGGVVLDDCSAFYRSAWSEFWKDATPRFDRVLMVGASPDVRAAVQASFHVVYDEGETLVLSTH